MLVQQHGAEFGEPVRRVFERSEDDSPFVDRERQERDAVVNGRLKAVGERIGSDARTVLASSATASASTGTPASITGRAYGRPTREFDSSGALERLVLRADNVTV